MEFLARRKKSTPAVIIVALIDVLIVVLIFLLVTTTFKQQPALKLTLPESSQAELQAGSSELNAATITIDTEGRFYLGASDQPVTVEELESLIRADIQLNPQLRITLAIDTKTPTGAFVKAMDAARSAGVKTPVTMMTQNAKAK
jgi:biopolymer transport protein ExbD